MTRSVCVCLFSGGIDSCLSAVLSKKEHSDIFLLSVNYGQVMQKELAAACELAEYIGAKEHRTVQIVGFEEISRSARTHEALIERNRGGALADGQVPSAYPPGRDFTFLSMAGAWAESVVLSDPEMYDQASIVIGTNRTDGLDYPDCQKRVYELFSNMLTESLKMSKVLGKRISVDTPLITLTKQEVVALGTDGNEHAVYATRVESVIGLLGPAD